MKQLKYTGISLCLLFYMCVLFLPFSKVLAGQDIKQTIDNYVETFLKDYRIPGASIALVHNNELFYSKSWGVTGESEEKVTTRTPFTIGSISKSLTGLAIMKLIEENTINLEDPVQKYIPWFTLKDKQAASKITIKHLLTHSSGISTYSGLSISDKASKDFNAIKHYVESLSNIELTAPPGNKHQYSNANFLILGALIEEVTKQTYSEYMEKQIFIPLGMMNAAADNDTAYEKGYLAGYESWLGFPRKSSVPYDNAGAPYGYITASAEDMVHYIKFLNQEDDSSILNKETMNLYLSPLFKISENRYYGAGLRITNPYSNDKIIWHSGSTPDSHSEVFLIPGTGWGGVILTNKNHILEEEGLPYLKQGIINILNGDKPETIPPNSPIVQLLTIGFICLLSVMFAYLLIKVKSGGTLKKNAWRASGVLLLALSTAIIPLLIHFVDSPWDSIKLFAADMAFLIQIVVFFLALNGLLSLYISYKQIVIKEGQLLRK